MLDHVVFFFPELTKYIESLKQDYYHVQSVTDPLGRISILRTELLWLRVLKNHAAMTFSFSKKSSVLGKQFSSGKKNTFQARL